MKNLFKITDAKIIITLIVVSFTVFFTLLICNTGKVEKIDNKKFVGVDAAGFMHYPDGHIERSDIKF